MGEVVALFSTDEEIYVQARKTVWRGLTHSERLYVQFVESDTGLLRLFHALERDFHYTKRFRVPHCYPAVFVDVLLAMHRFTDELSYVIATLREGKIIADDYNYGYTQMPA